MSRGDLERLSKDELIELKLQRPAKTSRTSSKPPSTDRKERRDPSRRRQAGPRGPQPRHCGGTGQGRRPPSNRVPGLRSRAVTRPAGRDGEPARADRTAGGEAHRGAAPAPGCDVPRMPGARSGTAAGRSRLDAVWAAPARHGGLPEDLPGSILRTLAEGAREPVRPVHQLGCKRCFVPTLPTSVW